MPIVPFDSQCAPDTLLRIAGSSMRVDFEAWTNRMPGPVPPSGRTGFPLNVLVRFTCVDAGVAQDSFLASAVTLWSTGGDSMLAALALVRTDGGAPWVRVENAAAVTELMLDSTRPRWLGGAPDRGCLPRVLVMTKGESIMISLPETPITAAY